MTLRAAVLVALVWAAAAAAQPGPATPGPAMAGVAQSVAAAKARAAAGDPAGALGILERLLNNKLIRLAPADDAALRLEAARQAIAAARPETAQTFLVAAERLGSVFRTDPALQARFLRELGRCWDQLGSSVRSVPLLRASLDRSGGSDPALVAETAGALGAALLELRRPGEAVQYFQQAITALDATRPAAGRLVAPLVNLTTAQLQTGNRADAEASAARAESLAGDEPALRRIASLGRAQLLLGAPDIPAAEALLAGIASQDNGADALAGHALLLLATSRLNRGLILDAIQPGLDASLAYRVSLGGQSPALGRAFHLLGTAYGELHNRRSAETFLLRAASIASLALGPASTQAQSSLIELAWLELQRGDIAAAEARAQTVLRVVAPLAAAEPRLAGLAHVLSGLVQEHRNRPAAAIEQFRLGQELIGRAGPVAEADIGFSLIRMARLLIRTNYAAAFGPIERAIAIYRRTDSPDSPRLADAILARAEWRAAGGDRRGALDDARQSHAGLDVGSGEPRRLVEGSAFGSGVRDVLAGQARLLLRLAEGDGGEAALLRAEAFIVTQQALASRAGQALRLAAVRQSAGNDSRAQLLKEREMAADAARQIGFLQQAALQQRGPEASQEASRLDLARKRAAATLVSLDERLTREAPALAASSLPRPVSIENLQSAIPRGSAMIATLTTADGLLIWILDRDHVTVNQAPSNAAEIASLVSRIRAGVDPQLAADVAALPPFDDAAARRLHQLLLGAAAPVIDGKKELLFILDGALQSLPPALLQGQTGGDWLVRRFALTIMPSIDSLLAGEGRAGSTAPLAFIGIGDPVLPQADAALKTASAERGLPPDLRTVLGSLTPLPGTRAELDHVAALFPPDETRLMLAANATRTQLETAQPDRYRVVSFATHAVMAGELPGISEPAIVLTSETDDPARSLLTASDIAGMTFDADLVLLSACNTAAPDGGPLAEGLSGLARSFLLAGARRLLVSHWTVDDRGTERLMVSFMRNKISNAGQSSASALRTAMLEMLDDSDVSLHQPALWAPFVLVGMERYEPARTGAALPP